MQLQLGKVQSMSRLSVVVARTFGNNHNRNNNNNNCCEQDHKINDNFPVHPNCGCHVVWAPSEKFSIGRNNGE